MGNFGADFNAARAAAKSFCSTAHAAGIAAVAGLSDARTPYQPYIGRGESLLALRALIEGRAEEWLNDHADRCRLLAAHVAALRPGPGVPSGGDVAKPLLENIVAQGGSEDAFYEKTDALARVSGGTCRQTATGSCRSICRPCAPCLSPPTLPRRMV